jgi:hypothetical protein
MSRQKTNSSGSVLPFRGGSPKVEYTSFWLISERIKGGEAEVESVPFEAECGMTLEAFFLGGDTVI